MKLSFLNKGIDIHTAQGWVARIVIILVLCLQPLYFHPRGYMLLAHHKYVFFAVYMCIVFSLIVLAWFYQRINRKPRLLSQDKPTVVEWAVLGFLLVTLLSASLTAYSRTVAFWGLHYRRDGAFTQVMYISVFFIISRWYIPRESDLVFYGVSAVIVALLGVLQFYGVDILRLWARLSPELNRIHFLTTIGNLNFVSTYACVTILLCGFLYVRFDTKWRYIWLAGSALNIWLLIISNSYSGMVGTIVTLILAVPFITQNKKNLGRFLILASSWAAVFFSHSLLNNTLVLHVGGKTGILILFAMLTCILLAAGFILTILSRKSEQGAGDRVGVGRITCLILRFFNRNALPKHADSHNVDDGTHWKRGVILMAVCVLISLVGVEILGRSESTGPVYQAREILRGNIQDDFGTNRIHIWRNALRVFPQRPLIGSGPDTFLYVFPEDAQRVFGELYDKAHNEYLQILICQGILGLLCYLVFLGAVFIKAVPHAFKNPLIMPVLAAFTGYCVQAFFNISLPLVGQQVWFFAGLLTSKKVLDMLKPAAGLSGKANAILTQKRLVEISDKTYNEQA